MTKPKRPDLTGLNITNTDDTTVSRGLIARLDLAPSPELVPITDVAPHPDNPRTTLGDLTSLAATIGGDGLIQPVVVIPAADWNRNHPDRTITARWVVIAGHRRLAAAHEAGCTTIRIAVRPDLADDQQTLVAMFVENSHRENLAPMDEAVALGRLRDLHSMSQTEIAKATGISQGQVSKRLTLLTLPEQINTEVTTGRLPVNIALRYAQLPEAEQGKVLADWTIRAVPLEQGIDTAERDINDQDAHHDLVANLTAEEGVEVHTTDPYTLFGANHQQHFLAADQDRLVAGSRGAALIESARTHGSAIAIVIRTTVNWYCRFPGPQWPWLDASANTDDVSTTEIGSPGYVDLPFDTLTTDDDKEDQGGTDFADDAEPFDQDDEPAPPKPTPRQPRTAVTFPSTVEQRRNLIRKFLTGRISTTRGATVLTMLTLVPSDDVEDPELVCQLLNVDGRTWSEHTTWVAQMTTTNDPTARLQAALAVAFARAETTAEGADRTPWQLMEPSHRLYLEVLATALGYPRADHELSPR